MNTIGEYRIVEKQRRDLNTALVERRFIIERLLPAGALGLLFARYKWQVVSIDIFDESGGYKRQISFNTEQAAREWIANMQTPVIDRRILV